MDSLGICSSCYVSPDDHSQQILSLALSDAFYSRSELVVHGQDIKNHLSPYIEQDILDRAKSMLEATDTKNTSTVSTKSGRAVSTISVIRKPDASGSTLTEDNPFAVLGASVRDNRQQIVELAEGKSLIIDSELCMQARSELTNPRKRISAEASWLPGVAPGRASKFIAKLIEDPSSVSGLQGSVPPLAQTNLLSAGLEMTDPQTPSKSFINWILETSDAEQQIVVEDVCRDINEDRAIAGFSDIRNLGDLATEIKSRREHYKETVLNTLDLLDPGKLVEVMTGVLESSTDHGKRHAPFLVDEIVDSYRNRVEGLLEREGKSIQSLVANIEENAERGEAAIRQSLTELDQKVRNWDKLAQPIQLSFQSRGMEHELSHEIAWNVRQMAVTLVNDHGMLDAIKGTVSMLSEIFAELPAVVERLNEDTTALDGLERQAQEQVLEEKEWARSISYSVEIGVVFKNRFEIGPNGVRWKNQHFPLESVSRVRWGGVRHSVNGIPTGTEFTIGFGDLHNEAVITLKKKSINQEIISKLWSAVGSRIMVKFLQDFANGNRLLFGSTRVDDKGIDLSKHKLFSGNEKFYHNWSQVQVWSAGGCFVVGSKSDKKIYEQFSYIDDENIHILEQIIRSSFKKPGSNLSNLLS